MFTGIIESLGRVKEVIQDGNNKHYWIEWAKAPRLKIDQSLAHDGVCLTIVDIKNNLYRVTAVQETLYRSTLDLWKPDKLINLERCIKAGARLDGHFVQGHVDTQGVCEQIIDQHGSKRFQFSFPEQYAALLIDKGSICVNGVSLTCFHLRSNSFEIALIPYTLEHTNFRYLKKGDAVNLEFDLLGKYIMRKIELMNPGLYKQVS